MKNRKGKLKTEISPDVLIFS